MIKHKLFALVTTIIALWLTATSLGRQAYSASQEEATIQPQIAHAAQSQAGSIQTESAPEIRGEVTPADSQMLVRLVLGGGRILAETVTDPNGRFLFPPLAQPQPAVFQLLTLEKEILQLQTELTYDPAQATYYQLALALDDNGTAYSKTTAEPSSPISANQHQQERSIDALYKQPVSTAPLLATSENRKVEISLASTGSIVGVITGEDTGQPIAGYVNVYDTLTNTNPIDTVYSAPDGRFTITNLNAGHYYLYFQGRTYTQYPDPIFNPLGSTTIYEHDRYLGEFYENKSSLVEAVSVTVSDATTTTINASLIAGGTLTGVVSAEDTGNPLAHYSVYVYTSITATNAYRSASTGVDGQYRIAGLAAGNYYLRIFNFNNSRDLYLPEYYPKQKTLATATPINVNLNQVTQIDIALARSGILKGVVTAESSGNPTENTRITVKNVDTGAVTLGSTNSTGDYSIVGLETGDYLIHFNPYNFYSHTDYNSFFGLLPEYFNNKTAYEAAETIHIPQGITTVLNSELRTAGYISGFVTTADTNQPLSVYMQLEKEDTGCGGWFFIESGYSSHTNGQYIFRVLDSGNYRITVRPTTHYSDDINAYADYTSSEFSVTAGQMTKQDFSLTKGGRISGQVTAADTNNPLESIWVEIYAQNQSGSGFELRDSTTTSANGYFTTTGLATGDYYILFDVVPQAPVATHAYIDEIHSTTYAATLDDATAVSVIANQTTQVNESLLRGAQVKGKATDEVGGWGLSRYAGISLRSVSGSTAVGTVGEAITADDGTYTTTAVLAGSDYTVEFSLGTYIPEFYNGKADIAEATTFALSEGQTRSDVNASLITGAKIRGHVTSVKSIPNQTIYVRLFDSEGREVNQTTTFYDDTYYSPGAYNLDRILPGTYKILFDSVQVSSGDLCLTYHGEYYQDQSSQDRASYSKATTITIVGTETIEGIDGTVSPYNPILNVFSGEIYLPLVIR